MSGSPAYCPARLWHDGDMRNGFEILMIGMAFFLGLLFAVWGWYEWYLGKAERSDRKPPTRPPYRRR